MLHVSVAWSPFDGTVIIMFCTSGLVDDIIFSHNVAHAERLTSNNSDWVWQWFCRTTYVITS